MRITKILLLLIIAVAFANCPAEAPSNGQKVNNFRFTKEYWGEWIRLDTGETWYINDKDIKIHGVPYPNKLSIRKENKNAIEVMEGTRKYYIYASRVKDGYFRGRVVDGSSGGVIGGSEQGVGSISVIISNLNNASDETIVMTDLNGNYIVEDIIPWDTYTVTINGKTWTVTPGDGDDVGIMALRDGVNLKASLTVYDADRLFLDEGRRISLDINIENVGNTAVSQSAYAYYSLESPGMYPAYYHILPGQHVSLNGLIPGNKQSIDIDFICDPLIEGFEDKRISITIVDPEVGITIKDYATIRIKQPVPLYFEAQLNTKAIIIAPYKKAYVVNNSPYGRTIDLPWDKNDYLLVLSNSKNTTYSIGIGVAPDIQWANLTDRNIYKPHNTEETATPIGLYEQKMAFLNAGEIAYYRINMGNANPSISVIENNAKLAEYADKVAVPALSDLPDFTPAMGIPVRNLKEASDILYVLYHEYNGWDAIANFGRIDTTIEYRISDYRDDNNLQGTTINNVTTDGTPVKWATGFGIYYFDFLIIEYSNTSLPGLGGYILSTKVQFDRNVNSYSNFILYEGGMWNQWFNNRYDDIGQVTRAAAGYIVSSGGFCAKVIFDYTFFKEGDFCGEGIIKVYGVNNQELFVKRILTRKDFKSFGY